MVNKKVSNAYAQDGVNVSSGDLLSQYAKDVATKTYRNSKFVEMITANKNYFRAPTVFKLKNLPDGCDQHSLGADGIGTKVGIHQATGTYDWAPFDLLAMVVDDAARHGILPLLVSNILSVHSTGKSSPDATKEERRNFKATKMIYNGLLNAANKSNIVLLGGETAEKGLYVGSEIPTSMALNFDMEAVMLGVSHPNKLITGQNLRNGQVVIALQEEGFRSNGISSVRKALAIKFGNDWWNNPEANYSIRHAARPSKIYNPLIAQLNGWYSKDFKPEITIHAVAHITGGGIEGKFAKDFVFKNGLSVLLDNLFYPPEIMTNCRKWRGMEEHEAYSTWNGGQGMLLVVDNDPQVIKHTMDSASKFNISAQVCGSIHKWKNMRMEIKSKFSNKNRMLIYKP